MAKNAHAKSGMMKREPKEYDEQVIQIDRVTKVVKGGRRLRFRATVVVGNRKGKIGIGIGKSNEVTGAIQKAIAKAKKGLITVPIDGSTIPHNIKLKYKAAHILFMPASPGTGLIAGGPVRKVLELAGLKDILSKCFGTKNKVNNTKCTFEALKRLKETPGMAKKAKVKAEAKAAEVAAPAPKTEGTAKPVAPKKAEAQKEKDVKSHSKK